MNEYRIAAFAEKARWPEGLHIYLIKNTLSYFGQLFVYL